MKLLESTNVSPKGKHAVVMGRSDIVGMPVFQLLQKAGATIRAFDPEGMTEAKRMLSDVTFCTDAYDTMKGAHAVALLTEWNQFRNLDFKRAKTLLKAPVLIDLRNVYTPADMAAAGFTYSCIGRGTLASHGTVTKPGSAVAGH